ncbi:WhiB family transcriptional regulator [Nocardia thraciensis]
MTRNSKPEKTKGEKGLSEWRLRAACRKYAPNTWFPDQRGELRRREVQRAVKICRTECPVRRHCAQEALQMGARSGIWGGVDLGEGANPLPSRRIADLWRVVRES